jgi:hypothetical protein
MPSPSFYTPWENESIYFRRPLDRDWNKVPVLSPYKGEGTPGYEYHMKF